MTKKIKVAFFLHGLGYGGALKSNLIMQKSLHRENIEMYTICFGPNPKTVEIAEAFKEYNNKFEFIKGKTVWSLTRHTMPVLKFFQNRKPDVSEVIGFIKNNEIDILHINSTVLSNYIPYIKQETDVKIIVHARETFSDRNNVVKRFIIKNITNYADKIIAISDNEAIYYPQDMVKILPNPTEIPRNIEDKVKGEIIIGMISNFLPHKGQIDFLRMAIIVKNQLYSNKRIKFMIVGYPNAKRKKTYKEYIKKALALLGMRRFAYKNVFDKIYQKFNLQDSVEIIPFTLDANQYLKSFDVYVRPLTIGQPWGRDIIEAMAMKKPVVATGTSEFFVEHGKTGFLVPPRNPQAMAEKVIELIENEKMRLEFGERGYEKIKNMCDIEEYGKRIKEIYEELIGD